MRTIAIAALILGSAGLGSAARCAAQSGTQQTGTDRSPANWSYAGRTGPVVWGKLDPAYQACSKGREQSPVDIRNTHLDKTLQPLQFHYIGGPITLENTGRGLIARVSPGSTMTANGVRYQLVELDFHHPSEHSIKGKVTDMEVDLVHRGDDGKMAIVAVRLNQDRGFPNALLATLWAHLPSKPGSTAKLTEMVNPGGLLPADRGYWTYMGSELEPPCTEGVRWFVFEQELSIGRGQFRTFRNFCPMNARRVQDAHGRRITANE